MKNAMKAKETTKLSTIRMIRTGFQNAAIEFKTDKLTDDQALAVLRKMAKQRKDSIDSYSAAGLTERAQSERDELAIMEQWLPTMASEDTLRGWILDMLQQQPENDTKNAGKVMAELMKEHKNVIDGKIAQRIIKEELAKLQ